MKYINVLLSIFAPLATVPTGWAIYAGVTGTPAFPMPPVWAGIGAVAIIIVNIAAGLLIVDVYSFNQANTEGERKYSQPLWWSWVVMVVGVLAEIVLSLLIVVFDNLLEFGVLAFPIMTLAGVFVVSIRSDLAQRQTRRTDVREKAEQERLANLQKEEEQRQAELARLEQERQERREERRKKREASQQAAPQVAPVAESKRGSIGSDESLLAYLRANAGKSHKEMAKDFGVSRSAIGQRITKLKETGKYELFPAVTK